MCKPDWNFWKYKTEIELWQAAFLSCDIDPDSESYRDIKHYGIDNEEVSKRLHLLKDNYKLQQFFSHPPFPGEASNLDHVKLPELAAWCVFIGFEIPKELSGMIVQKIPGGDVLSGQNQINSPVNKKKWTDEKLKTLWSESIQPDVSHADLAKKYNVKRQRIEALLKQAKERFGIGSSLASYLPSSRIIKGTRYK